MKIEKLLKMDMDAAVEWLIENERYFELAPRVPNQDMLFGVDETELNEYCTSSRQSTQHELGKSIYVEMIKRIK
tara:strand:+ start:375 stop:596 length:222 start_codon:yes stop_codon:yes gene_type:complete